MKLEQQENLTGYNWNVNDLIVVKLLIIVNI